MIIYYSGITKACDPRDMVPNASVMAAFTGSQKTELRGVSYFLDSGAFSLFRKGKVHHKENGVDRWAYFKKREHKDYLDGYARFVKARLHHLDHYANVDVIGNARLSWRNQQYLESEHGLSPVPVIHTETSNKWIEHYLEKGYKYIGFGGLAGKSLRDWSWVDHAFKLLKGEEVKVHGFGVTGYLKLIRYPWFSVDSTTWVKTAGYGQIIVPYEKRGNFIFSKSPIRVFVTGHEKGKSYRNHIDALRESHEPSVMRWLKHIDVELDGDPKKLILANLRFFEMARTRIECIHGYEENRGWHEFR